MEVRPIKTEEDYKAVLAEIERLFEAEPNSPGSDCLDVLTTLVSAYEQQHYPIGPPDPIEALLYHLESRGMTQRELVPYIGSRTRVTEILERRRSLTIDMIRRLSAGLNIPADILIQPYTLYRKTA